MSKAFGGHVEPNSPGFAWLQANALEALKAAQRGGDGGVGGVGVKLHDFHARRLAAIGDRCLHGYC